MSAVSRGNAAERYVAKWLQDRGWIVGSRRHIGGAGDLLAVHPEPLIKGGEDFLDFLGDPIPTSVWLIEVKAAKELWQQFRREDRQAMRDTFLPPGGERFCVNVRGKELEWYPESSWP